MRCRATAAAAASTRRVRGTDDDGLDDFPANATTTDTIGMSAFTTGSIESAGDQDWFQVELTARRDYRAGRGDQDIDQVFSACYRPRHPRPDKGQPRSCGIALPDLRAPASRSNSSDEGVVSPPLEIPVSDVVKRRSIEVARESRL